LGWGPHFPRQFGGVGLMIDAPGIGLTVEPASSWQAEGPLADRALRVAERLVTAGVELPSARIVVRHAPQEHVGLGVGTQLSLGVARLLLRMAGHHEPSAATLAALCGRGLRSGVGLHGFGRGGLIVDGGRRTDDGIPPLLAHLDFPPEWKVLVILPEPHAGLHGAAEVQAFAQLPPIPVDEADRLCRLVLMGLMPAVLERDLPTFGMALAELQERVGRCFAPAQGGIFARPELTGIVKGLESEGLHGAGQSSWGPTLYAFSNESDGRRSQILDALRERFSLPEGSAFWTSVSERGAILKAADGG
jgi:beta-RFAP synthase